RGQVVEDGDLVARLQQVLGDHAADVSCPARHQVLHQLATSRSRSAARSGGTSLMNTLMPDSEPARNFSLPDVRRMVTSSRCSAKSSRVTPSNSSSVPNGAWCQAAM